MTHGRYQLLYCDASSSWTFVAVKEGQDIQQICQTQWLISSKEDQTSYSVFTPDSWVEFSRKTGVTNSDIVLKCNQCEKENELVHCNRGGECNNGRCECRPGGFGPLCEFAAPCLKIRTSGSAISTLYRGDYTMLGNEKVSSWMIWLRTCMTCVTHET
jgi:hypothetical protein